MRKCEVKKTMTLTVEPGSQVILSDAQYNAVKGYVTPLKSITPERESDSSAQKTAQTKAAAEKKPKTTKQNGKDDD